MSGVPCKLPCVRRILPINARVIINKRVFASEWHEEVIKDDQEMDGGAIRWRRNNRKVSDL